jgi:hypothetical protein
VVDFLQVFDLAGRQKSPDFIQCPFALDGVLEVALSCGITASNHEKYFSGDEQGHLARNNTASRTKIKPKSNTNLSLKVRFVLATPICYVLISGVAIADRKAHKYVAITAAAGVQRLHRQRANRL